MKSSPKIHHSQHGHRASVYLAADGAIYSLKFLSDDVTCQNNQKTKTKKKLKKGRKETVSLLSQWSVEIWGFFLMEYQS